jgi:hypothetical protein
MRHPMATPNQVKAYAQKLGFTVGPLVGERSISSHYVLRATPTAAPVEVYFRRPNLTSAWQWATALHRVPHTDKISRAFGGQPELTTMTAFKAYLALLSVVLEDRPLTDARPGSSEASRAYANLRQARRSS